MTLQQSFSFAPQEERQAAHEKQARRNLVIEAGAGTGKTTAIVAEVLKLMLEHDDLAPERIVLMTFTEKAAGEIADRIRMALEELSRHLESGSAASWPIESPQPLVPIDDTARASRAIAHHLANIDSLRSQTIHSFCQSLLRAFPIEAGLDPQFKIIEGFERSLLYEEVYDAWLDAETRVDPDDERVAEWELLFTHFGYLFQIRDLVLTLLDRRDLLGESGYEFGGIADFEPALVDAIHAIRNSQDDNGDEHAQNVYRYVRGAAPNCPSVDEWLAYLQPIAASIREANLPKKGVLKDAMKVLRAGEKGRSVYDRLASHRAAMALVAVTRRFVDYLDAEKRKLGVVDFDDLLLRTSALLEDDAVLARARDQFDYIFVDEFQDTDRTQARIIDRLARDSTGAYVPGRTIVVGDPKQSIYGFRRADPETYHRMTEGLVAGGAEKKHIRHQFRSDAPLVETINAMFARLFPEQREHDPNVFSPSYTELAAARPVARRELDARVTLLAVEHDDKSDRYFVEADAVAKWIEDHRDGSANDLQRFAILFRRLTRLDDYLDVLEQHRIDYVLPPTRMFLDRRAPVDLLAVLRAIAYQFDRGAQISAARTPYFALTDVEIAEGGEACSVFVEAMSAYREASRHLMVSQLIDLVVKNSGIEDVYRASADGVRNLRHLEHVRSIAFQYDQRTGGSVRQFVDEIARRRDDPEEMEPSLADDSHNAVRILSVHAAKGLEFDTVILPDLSFPTGSSDSLQFFTVEEPRSLVLAGRADSISANFRFVGDEEKLKKIAGRREEAETRRLFYVAVTRAKTDVVFVCNVHEETRHTGFLKCLCDALDVEKGGLAAMWPADARELRETAAGNVAFERPAQGERTTSAGGDVAGERAARLLDAAAETRLRTSEIVPLEITPPAAVTATLTAAEVAARRAGSRSRVAGILLHRVLELWDGRSSFDALLRQCAVETAADADAVSRVRRRLATVSTSPMLRRIARAETIGREMPIRFVEDGLAVERRIDRLVREDGADLVIDYKSGDPEAARVEKDREQVARYCRAIREMTGRECNGVLWYIGLDGDTTVEVRRE